MSAVAAEVAAPAVTVVDAFTDDNLLGASFGGETREAWRAILSGAFALPMQPKRYNLFKQLSGRREPPAERVRELWAIAGRRSDKSHTAAGIAVYLATIGAAQQGILSRLSAGERGVILCLACDRSQAKVVLQYVRGLLEDSPVLASMVSRVDKDTIALTNGVSIEVGTNSHRAVRGRTLLAAILDEVAFFRSDESATPDTEVYRALVPSLATTGGMLIGISSPYARRGLLYDKWRKHFGRDGDVLVTQASTKLMNPTVSERIIREAYADDPEAAKAEWGGEFRADVEAFLTREVVERCTRTTPLEIPHQHNQKYFAFVDPAGGGNDEFCVAIGHREGDFRAGYTTIVDCVRAQRGTPSNIVLDYAGLLKSYGLNSVTGDKYAGSWPADEFERHKIKYHTAEKPKSGLYLDLLPALNSERVELPPCNKLASQLASLERKTSRAGRDSIDHPPNGHDDRANVVAGLVASQSGRTSYTLDFL